MGVKVEDVGIQTEEPKGKPPEYNADVMEFEGWSAEDQEEKFKFAEKIEAMDKDKADKYHVMPSGPKKGLISNIENGEPITPVTVNPRVDGQIEVTNPRFYRPADLWRAMGAVEPPVWSKRGGGRFIPWPRFGQTDKKIDKNLCHVNDIKALASLNKKWIDKINTRSRAITVDQGQDVRTEIDTRPVTRLQSSTLTAPLQVVADDSPPILEEVARSVIRSLAPSERSSIESLDPPVLTPQTQTPKRELRAVEGGTPAKRGRLDRDGGL